MKQLFVILFLTALIFACKEKPKNPVAEYGNAMVNSYMRGKEAGKTANLYTIKQSLQAYYAAHGTYPETLDDLEDLIGGEIDSSMFEYDPQTGKVTLKSE